MCRGPQSSRSRGSARSGGVRLAGTEVPVLEQAARCCCRLSWRASTRLVSVTTAVLRSSPELDARLMRPWNGESSFVFSRSHSAEGNCLRESRGGSGVLTFGSSSVTNPLGSGFVLLIRRN